MSILKIKARKTWDSRSMATVEVDLITDIGLFRSSVPTSLKVSENAYEELRDKAPEMVNSLIGPELVKLKLGLCNQKNLDELLKGLDGTDKMSKLGSVAISAVSMAYCKAGAAKSRLPLYQYIAKIAENKDLRLPVPAFSLISGGVAANNDLVYRDFMILPIGATSFSQALEIGTEIYRELEKKLANVDEVKIPLAISENGAFVPQALTDDKEAVSIIAEAIKDAGYEQAVKIAINVAASDFSKQGMYDLDFKTEDADEDDYMEAEDLLEEYKSLKNDFPIIISIQDPFDADNFENWTKMALLDLQIVSDDLTAMNPDRIQEAIDLKCANNLLLKSWQIGCVSQVIDCAKIARLAGWKLTCYSGFGLTNDNFAADLSVGLGCAVFKGGAPGRPRYNDLLRIEEELGETAIYAGKDFLS